MRSELDDIPTEYSIRIRELRKQLGLTQVQMADRVGVSFATMNRWENRQSKPTRLAWREIVGLEAHIRASRQQAEPSTASPTPNLDFGADPAVVSTVAAATRLAYGHLHNPAFATEISTIDPLPHQRIAVYEHMLGQSPLRFLLADDAGAGKTIMTGLYLREALARRLVERILVVPPAGLVGNWESEMRKLFRLPFRVARGADTNTGNPFVGPESERIIVSIDTLAGKRMFEHLREAVTSGAARPYDIVVFDEAHKLAADREGPFGIRKTDRYRLAETLAGIPVDDERWHLGWSARNILLLTATPHMGKDFPYYCLWRLLAPEELATFGAFEAFPETQRRRHFIRRTKEEMIRFDGRPLYPQRRCDTLSYDLSPQEQNLYEATTRYIVETYNQARVLNRSAARLAMSVFQRRLASSTHALMRSFERRLDRLDDAIKLVRTDRVGQMERLQADIAKTPDFFETHTADEDTGDTGEPENHEAFEKTALGGLATTDPAKLEHERTVVEGLLSQAHRLTESGEDSKFKKLRAIMTDPAFAGEKLIVFTEHRDTAEFLVRRLEGLGFTDQVGLIHGGLDYREREAQVDFFRCPADQGGADFLVATDAAGEGINLQFCGLMANYDVPWNPARLEQRMGRIHRYGQKRDPVMIINLIAGETREGRVLKVLLDKLETIRRELHSDKVFDVVGRLFENLPLKDYLEMALTEAGTREAIEAIGGRLTPSQMTGIDSQERDFHSGNAVRARLSDINADMEREQYRRLLPGHVRHFVQTAAPLIDLRLDGDAGDVFDFTPVRPRAADDVREAMEIYPEAMRGRLTVHRPKDICAAIWIHPGEPVFDCFRDTFLSRWGDEAKRGAVFTDPNAEDPYLVHLAELSVVKRGKERPETVEIRPVGLRQEGDGTISPCSPEHLLLLRGARNIAPGGVPLARLARRHTTNAIDWLQETALRMAAEHRTRIEKSLPERRRWIVHGNDQMVADLMTKRQRLSTDAHRGDPDAQAELDLVKEEQSRLVAKNRQALASLDEEPSLIGPGETKIFAHALVVPTDDPEERTRHNKEVEAIAMGYARAHEEAAGAIVRDVSRPVLARREGLDDWPGFDLHSSRPASAGVPAENRAIEVKGRAGTGAVEVKENEWAAACNLRDGYWLYVVFDCATTRPRLVKIRDPFGRLLAKKKGGVTIAASEVLSAAEKETS